MVDFIDKKQELRRYFPKSFYRFGLGDKGLGGILDTFGEQLNTLQTQIGNARSQLLLATASGEYLEQHGIDRDVYRPNGFNMSDEIYRNMIKIVSNSPKNIEHVFERLLTLFFGPNALSDNKADVYSYRKGELVIEIQANALIVASSRNLLGTTYLHRDPTGHYDGAGTLSWSSVLAGPLNTGDVSFTLASVPAGCPVAGFVEIGSVAKQYIRSGAVFNFRSPILSSFSGGTPIKGPQAPDDYPSGYMFDRNRRADIFGNVLSGASGFTLGTIPNYGFPSSGVIHIGEPGSATFETKGFTRSGTALSLLGVTQFGHASGEQISIPIMPRSIKTTLNQSIVSGSSWPEITVANAADFQEQNIQGVVLLARSYANSELVPFRGRKTADNSKIVIDPSYVFANNHASGETVHLMALQTLPAVNGIDYPFYLNDTDKLRGQFFSTLSRCKVTGFKMKVEIID